MKKLTLTLIASAVLAGCSSFPSNYEKPLEAPDLVQEKADDWSNLPAVTFVQSTTGVVVRKYNKVPEAVLDKRITINVQGNVQLTLHELAKVLSTQGIKVSAALLGDDSRKQLWAARHFDGTLAELLDSLTTNHNIAVEHRSGMTYLVEGNRFSASLPQHMEFLEQVATALDKMGATDVRTDVLSGQVYFVAKPNVADYIEEYLTAIAKNSAMVTLQVAVLTVGMNRDVNLGFDWAKLAAQRGTGPMRADVGSILKSSTNVVASTPGSAANPSDTTSAVQQVLTGSMLSFSGSDGFGYKFANNAFSMTAALKALSLYGNARTEQNVVLGTLSGLPVKITSGNDIPYVKSVGAATAAGGGTSGTSQTDIIKSGLTLNLTPNFDATDGTVTTSIKVDMSTLVAFRELSAGQSLGTLSQPEMQKLEFENVGRLNAGETIIVGGITYDQVSNNYTNFPGMESKATGSKTEKVNRNAIYIVVRPTVVIFTPDAQALSAKLKTAELEAARLNRKAQKDAQAPQAPKDPAAPVAPVVPVAPPGPAPQASAKLADPALGLSADEELLGVSTQASPSRILEGREVQ